MVEIGKVNPVYPNWQDRPKKNKQKSRESDESEKKQGSYDKHQTPEDGQSHIDEFA